MKYEITRRAYEQLKSEFGGVFFSTENNCWYVLEKNHWIPFDSLVGESIATFISHQEETRIGYGSLMEQVKLLASQKSPLNDEAKYIINTRTGVIDLHGLVLGADLGDSSDTSSWFFAHQEDGNDNKSLVINKKITEITVAGYLDKNKSKPARFIDFIEDIFRGDQELIHFFWLYLASILTGDTSDHRFFVCFGTGANGKSTLLRVLEGVFGTYIAKVDPTILHARTDTNVQGLKALYRLRYKRLIILDEPPAKLKLDVPFLKRITGEDSLPIPEMGKRNWAKGTTFQLESKVIMDTNHLPNIPDVEDEGLWRRLTIIPFRPTVPLDERNENLLQELLEEKDQILTYIVDQWYRVWLREKLKSIPKKIKNASRLYIFSTNPVRYFLRNRVVVRSAVFVGVEKLQSIELWKCYLEYVQMQTNEFEEVFGLPIGKGNSFIASGSNKMISILLEQKYGGIKTVVQGRHYWSNVSVIPIGVDSEAQSQESQRELKSIERAIKLEKKALQIYRELQEGSIGEQKRFLRFTAKMNDLRPDDESVENCMFYFEILASYLIHAEKPDNLNNKQFIYQLISQKIPKTCKKILYLNAAIHRMTQKIWSDFDGLIDLLVQHCYLIQNMGDIAIYEMYRVLDLYKDSKDVKAPFNMFLGFPDYLEWAENSHKGQKL